MDCWLRKTLDPDVVVRRACGAREEMTKWMRGRREGGKSVGSMASHWLMLMLPKMEEEEEEE